jgi:hypothetical protein
MKRAVEREKWMVVETDRRSKWHAHKQERVDRNRVWSEEQL